MFINGTYKYKGSLNTWLLIVEEDNRYEIYSEYNELMYTAYSYVDLAKFLTDLGNDFFA